MRPELLDSFEKSMLGVMEPEVFLKAALAFAALEVDRRAIPEPDPVGRIRFQVLGAPEGMHAVLSVSRPRNPRFADLLSLEFTVDPPMDPYVVEGSAREAPRAQVSVWRNHDGEIVNFGVLSTLDTDGANNRARGIRLDADEIPMGMHYSIDVADPSKTVVAMSGIKDGAFVRALDRPTRLGREARPDQLRELGAALLAMYARAKE
jgi:hypothetical protein